jgi:hypothetical protein
MEYISNTYSVQVYPALQEIVSNTFPVQVNAATGTIVSNTFSTSITLPAGKQAVVLTSVAAASPLFGLAVAGDEWIIDTYTNNGLSVVPQTNGLYSVTSLQGSGPQEFEYAYISVGNSYDLSALYTEYVDSVDLPDIISNTFSATLTPPLGTQVLVLTSITAGTPVDGILDIGDEWITDLITDGGLPVVINADGSFTVTGITGQGNQEFDWFAIDVSTGYSLRSPVTQIVIDPATLDVAPSISVHPTNQSLTEGTGTVSFTVVATAKPDPTYQWQVNGVNILGATSSTLDVYGSQQTLSNTGDQYRVIVSSTLGSVNSNIATLTIDEAAKAPVITLQPLDQTLEEGSGSVTYTVSATAINPIAIQWQIFDGVSISDIPGETSTSITVAGNTVTHAINNGNGYRARFTNTEGTVYSNIAALFVTPIEDTAPDASLTATEVMDTSLNVRFTADEAGAFRLVLVSNNAAAPTVEQVFTGTAPGLVRSSPAATMDVGVEVITPFIGLATYTSYDVYGALEDAEGNTRLLDRLDIRTTRDTTIPVIQLLGPRTMYVPMGSVFTDPGAILTDNVDPDTPISGVGTVLYNTVGQYSRAYNGTDLEGNAAIEVTRVVIVYDPALSDNDGGVITDVIDEVIEIPIDDVID